MRALLVAEEAAGVHALRLLVERGVEVEGVLTTPAPERGASVAGVAAEHGIPRLEPERVREPAFAEWIAAQEVDLLLNIHSLLIIDAAVLAAPRIGSFNLHPGPLPNYAGLNSPSWAIAEGEHRHAVTLHWMAAGIDTGPVAYEAWFEIEPKDTGLRVATRAVSEGIPLLERLLDDAERGAIPSREQEDPDGGSYHGREVPHDGDLPWHLGARAVVDLVRAADYAPFPSPWGAFRTKVGGEELSIVRVAATGEATAADPGTIGAARDQAVPVSGGDEWVLVERVRLRGESVPPASVMPAGSACEPVGP